MIQLSHLAVGALAGRGRSGPFDALLAGIVSHAAVDVPPHGEVHDDAFELATAVGGILLLASRHGLASPIVWGAIGGTIPDLEHVLPRRIRPARAIFPTHRFSWTHGEENLPFRIPAWMQAVLGGAVLGVLASRGRRPRGSVQTEPGIGKRGRIVTCGVTILPRILQRRATGPTTLESSRATLRALTALHTARELLRRTRA